MGEEDIAEVVAMMTGIPVKKVAQSENKKLVNMAENLKSSIIGQDEAVKLIAEAMRRIRGGLAEKNKPISFLFLGPTGVGKTEAAKSLARIYYRGEAHIVSLDISDFADEEGRKRLLETI